MMQDSPAAHKNYSSISGKTIANRNTGTYGSAMRLHIIVPVCDCFKHSKNDHQ